MTLLDFFANGLSQASGWQILGYTLLTTHISIVAVTVYLHRAMAHRAMDMHPALAHFFRFWAWLTTATITKEWVSVHRKHHAKCETEDDPHSPVVKGLKTVLLTGAELYKKEASNEETTNRYGKGCPDDWLENNLYQKYKFLGIFTLLAINIALFGAIGITVWAIQMLWMPFHAAGVINGLGHWFGYRNFECSDAATNISPIGIWIGGEELHNNHHTYPNSAKLSVKPWEFDIGWGYIRVFEKLGLVKNVRRGPVVHVDKSKLMLDKDSVLAAANNRFQIMAKYRKRVIKPVVAEQRQAACETTQPLMKRAKKLLTREQSLLSAKHQQQLQTLLEHNEMMEKLYEMKEQLQQVWKKRTSNSEELIKAMEDWCKRAEESGIQALQDFADSLKYYSTGKAAR
ncbi:acyl-CoA desaturase [Bermanella marisrubri]|uniref:Fatty acid desaturase n=1 Tax=Bermanella marisrubri TaxID=207949 RepID=Q1N158_9GAMM|nr:transposase [Bermanella marisrubri]EAT11993.1 Fatty acid desaturase [Oceanobacter sp. RED65] [Bermanella marisrubri]QIZ84797.1 acyl-CoA desaturase [Bermanella marisrubri]